MLRLIWAPDDGGGSGGDGGAADSAGGDGGNPFGTPKSNAGGAGDAGGDGGHAPYYPESFPDHLKGKDERETLDKVFGAYSGMRDSLSKRGTVPKEAKDYKFELSENAAKVIGGDLTKDRTVQIFRTIAHKHELTDKQAAAVFRDFNDEMLGTGLIQVLDPNKEARAILGDAAVGRSDQEVMEMASQRWQTLASRVDGLVNSKAISPEQAAAAKAMMDTSHGVLFLESMFKMSGEHGLQTGGHGAGSGGITKAELDKRINDPRGNPMHPLYDKSFEEETNRLGEEFFNKQNRAA